MRPLPKFIMEEPLERERFAARFNLGESGGRPRSLGDLLRAAFPEPQMQREWIDALVETPLRDSPNYGRFDLRQRIAELHPGACAEEILITTGTSEALFLLLRALRPQRVALLQPAFQLLEELPRSLGAEILGLPAPEGALAGDELRACVVNWCASMRDFRPDLLLLNHPHNPSGQALDDASLETLARTAEELGAAVVADEHYRFLVEDAPLGPTLYGRGKRVFVTGSFIKCLGMPGLRIGWCVGAHEVLAAMQNEKNYTTHTVNPFAEATAELALSPSGAGNFVAARAEWLENRAVLQEWLAGAGAQDFRGTVPQGGLVMRLFLKRPCTEEEWQALNAAVRARGVFLLTAQEFAPGLEGSRWWRLGLGLSPADLRAALAQLDAALQLLG